MTRGPQRRSTRAPIELDLDAEEGTEAGPPTTVEGDPRIIIDRLQQRWREEREQRLNAVDALVGAEAAVAQAKAETEDVLYRLHVRETELEQSSALLAELEARGLRADPTVADAARNLLRALVRSARRAAGR